LSQDDTKRQDHSRRRHHASAPQKDATRTRKIRPASSSAPQYSLLASASSKEMLRSRLLWGHRPRSAEERPGCASFTVTLGPRTRPERSKGLPKLMMVPAGVPQEDAPILFLEKPCRQVCTRGWSSDSCATTRPCISVRQVTGRLKRSNPSLRYGSINSWLPCLWRD